MTDAERFIKLSDLKRKLNYIFKQYGVPLQMKNIYLNEIGKLPYTVAMELEKTLKTDETESEETE